MRVFKDLRQDKHSTRKRSYAKYGLSILSGARERLHSLRTKPERVFVVPVETTDGRHVARHREFEITVQSFVGSA